MTVFASALRVYEPLAAFEGDERERWEAYARDGGLPVPAAEALERGAVLAALVHRRLPVTGDHAHVIDVDGVTMVCPWHTELLAREALVDFCAELPDLLIEAFVPPTVLEQAEVELDRWRTTHGSTLSHVRTCAWHVPLRWFVLVDPHERQVNLGDAVQDANGAVLRRTGRSLTYRTPMSRARRRVARALKVLRLAIPDDSVGEGVAELGQWLEEFHPRSVVELDYGGLVHLLDDAELSQDESARDMAVALEKLAAGEGEQATAAYRRMTARMKALQSVETSN